MESARLAVDTCFWPLYEIENGILKVTYKPKEKKPVIEWLKTQNIDLEWERLLDLDGKRI
jgi:pyruvate ferredoxin oxidoreductase beta subunit